MCMIVINAYFSTFSSNQKAFNFIFKDKTAKLISQMFQMSNTWEMMKDIYPSLLYIYFAASTSDEPFRITQFCETTEVMFGDLSPEVIRGYIATGEPM